VSERPVDLNAPRWTYGNFKPDKTSRYWPSKASKARTRRAEREGNSEAHLNLIRMLPCTVCHRKTDIHAHHLQSLAAARERGVGQKATDKWAVSLCGDHHMELHGLGSRREPEWFDEFGMNAHALAMAYWQSTGDFNRLNRILLAHKLAASRVLLERK
jgi:hypothetical protein